MHTARYGLAIVVSATVAAGVMLGSPAQAAAADAPAEASDAGAPKTAARGLVVLATPGAEGAAWALAKEVYARDALRPAALDEARARVLAGEPAAPGAPRALKDLADERAAVHGDDGASRALLREIAAQLGVRAIVVVAPGTPPSARVFLAEGAAFDAARYSPEPPEPPTSSEAAAPSAASDAGMAPSPLARPASASASASAALPPPRWGGTVASLERTLGEPGAPSSAAPAASGAGEKLSAPALATSAAPDAKPKPAESHPFYTSPWFWGAVGAAAFGGAAVWFATRDNTPSAIHLQLQVH